MNERIRVSVDRRPHLDQATICVAGEIDITTAGELLNALYQQCLEPPQKLVVDLSDVTFMGATAIGLIAYTADRVAQQGCRLVIEGARPYHDKLLRRCGLDHLLVSSS
jgi:anti-anti-sigma factor